MEFLPFATNGYVGSFYKQFNSYMTQLDDKGFYVSQNSGNSNDHKTAVELTQEDIDAGNNKIFYRRMVTGKYHLELYIFPYENAFDLAVNTFKSQQGDLADISFDNTINIAGTLSDDTEFSYNALVK